MEQRETVEPTLSFVTVTFNSEEFIRGCIRSAAEGAGRLSFEHVVVDNASYDASVKVVEKEFPDVLMIENTENRGFTRANNQGMEKTRGKYVVFLNPDTLVPPGTFETMVGIMEKNPQLGVLAPRLVDGAGKLSMDMGHKMPTALTMINSFMLLNRLSHDLFPGVYRTKDIDGLEICDWACGACLMVPKDVAHRYPWRAFGAGDDLDFCSQIREAGWQIGVTGDAEVTHFAGRSWKLAKPKTLSGTPSHNAQYVYDHQGPVLAALGIAGMRLGMHLRAVAHRILYWLNGNPERLHNVNKLRQFLSHDDYCVFRKTKPTTPSRYPG